MDAFKTHSKVISNYKDYLHSFLSISDERIKNEVDKIIMGEGLIPEPLIQFNPSFQKGETLNALIEQNLINSNLPKTFGGYSLYKHQIEAIKIGIQDKGFVVTSGTGSGKSLTFLATVFNYLFNLGSEKKKGIKAILVYPMNALINSQEEEIKKYAENFGNDFPITFGKYTGQESAEAREILRKNEPDVILTNYMMLELIMTRQSESWLRSSLEDNLQFLVYDELHTYRGRQGADVSYLNRRIQANCKNDIICIGTSATMASDGSPDNKKREVAKVAAKIFGKSFHAEQIVGEYLETCTEGINPSAFELAESLKKGIDHNWDEVVYIKHSITNWLEINIALKDNHGVLERGKSLSIKKIAQILKDITSLAFDEIELTIINVLKWTEKLNEENRLRNTRKSFLPFRFHQFISQTSSVSVTLEPRNSRTITIKSGRYIKDKSGQDKMLYPILFSRYSGVEFICVEKDIIQNKLNPVNPDREFKNLTNTDFKKRKGNISEDDFKFGYIVLDDGEDYWNEDPLSYIPNEWLNNNGLSIQPYYEWLMPAPIYFDAFGNYSLEPKYPTKGYFIAAKLRIDPTAGVIYEDSKTSEFTKLTRLGSEGRSTATTVISYSVIDTLFEQNEKTQNQKLLSFTDNRQDASLQAGHFNDFLSSIKLRAGLYKALQNNLSGINVHEIAERVFDELKLREDSFASYPSQDPDFPDEENSKAIKEYILYRIFQDLKRGWRYTIPNLEQTALLKVEYKELEKLSQFDDKFSGIYFFDNINPNSRKEILFQVLNFFRTNYSLDHRLLKNRQETEAFLKNKLDDRKLWSLDKNEDIDTPSHLVSVVPKQRVKGKFFASMGSRSGIGKYLKRKMEDAGVDTLNQEDFKEFIETLCDLLTRTNFLAKEEFLGGIVKGYQLRTDKIIWLPGDEKTVQKDETRLNTFRDIKLIPNSYFKKLYKVDFSKYDKEIIGKEHTGQLANQDRITREEQFREGKISTLFCSPTMELGIDIANLNIVHMRNVPPNPANYAQRSGRAGRSGQTAVVFTYCSAMSPHDQNYFKAAETMVSGTVVPPRIDLLNEDLLSTHFNSFMLMNLEISDLQTSVADILDLSIERKVKVKQSVIDNINNAIDLNKIYYKQNFLKVVKSIEGDLENAYWFSDSWIDVKINSFSHNFEAAFARWIALFLNACNLRDKAQLVIDNHIIKSDSPEKNEAKRQEAVARKQISLLKNDGKGSFSNDSEFYVFRYLAAEGFLPGYNFTRLPIRTFLGYSFKGEGEYVSRPRSLALREFGPGNIVYHNGNKYRINRMSVLDTDNSQRKIKISKETGYAYLDDDASIANVDPITKNPLRGDNMELNTNLIELSESEGIPVERISCIEEERSGSKYEVSEYFRYAKGLEHTKSLIIAKNGQKLLNLIYDQATELIKLNRKMRRSQEEGFRINKTNGVWIKEKDLEKPEIAENSREVMIFARDTADTLYIQPLSNLELTAEQTISLSFALKRGIEKLFQVEENEIGVSVLGNPEKPNILLYEASEGSLGILSQLIEEPQTLRLLFEESYRYMHFDPETREETERGKQLPKASYEDLLSYYNQIHHEVLDRHSIKEPLERLMDCEFSVVQNNNDREKQYQYLLENYDKNSNTELKLLRFLYQNNYVLPSKAQVNIQEFYISADFVLNTNNGPVLIFCDGNVHDLERVQESDKEKRRLLKDAGYDILEWHHSELLEDLVIRRKDILRKLK
ncbi:DEAD/DEAH box helicase [Pedobacter sp. Leaf250]|uniref:DEAD/DEAH box helicase n=1 Tax=Pedobacter sp. Leaf250 TaxID=2876559 RepID=UPI001E2C13DC|nr:DEAD/DEAH box helicase [Pedobacter sp. Leaf250]